jgi:hypothetical protein
VSDQYTDLQDPAPAATTRRLPLLLALLAVLVLGAGGWIFLTVTGDDDVGVPPADALDVDDGSAVSTDAMRDDGMTGGASILDALPVVTYEVFLSRDPFDPVVPEEVPAEVIDTTNPALPTDGTELTPTTGAQCTGTQEVVCNGQVVSLLNIMPDADGNLVAVVQIDATIHEVRKGDVFVDRYVLLDVTPTTATISYVDEAFTLRIGDSLLK